MVDRIKRLPIYVKCPRIEEWPGWANWWAADASGNHYCYQTEPKRRTAGWENTSLAFEPHKMRGRITLGRIKWTETLVSRHEKQQQNWHKVIATRTLWANGDIEVVGIDRQHGVISLRFEDEIVDIDMVDFGNVRDAMEWAHAELMQEIYVPNWGNAPSWANWWAINSTGDAWWYETRPGNNGEFWYQGPPPSDDDFEEKHDQDFTLPLQVTIDATLTQKPTEKPQRVWVVYDITDDYPIIGVYDNKEAAYASADMTIERKMEGPFVIKSSH